MDLENHEDQPYFLVRSHPWPPAHHGPFTTYYDATMARQIAAGSWRNSRIVNETEFNTHLADNKPPLL